MRKLHTRVLMLVMIIVATGCAAGAATSGRTYNVITRAEISELRVSSMYDAIQRLRPRWLDVRSQQTLGGSGDTSILVYQNNARLGGPDILRQIDPGSAEWVEYLDGPTASATLPGIGAQHVEGAIVIHTTPRDG